MKLEGEKIKFKNERIVEILEEDGDKISICIDGIIKKYNYKVAFKKGVFELVNEDLQREIIDKINSEDQTPTATGENDEQENGDEIVKGFDEDYHPEYLQLKPILTYSEVEKEYGIKIAGFGRGINVTDKSIVLISYIKKQKDGLFVYHDKWEKDGHYIYSGEGRIGDQTLTKGNKALAEASKNNKPIYLFIKFSSTEYYFQGRMFVKGYKLEDDNDADGNLRKEYKFKLKRVE